MEWHSKKQASVKTYDYGSEHSFSRAYIEKIVDLRVTLKCLEVSLRKKSRMFGDSKSVIDSSMTSHIEIHNRCTNLSFYLSRETVASGITYFCFFEG